VDCCRRLAEQVEGARQLAARIESACTSPRRNPGPIDPEAFSLPSDHRVRLDQVQGLSQVGRIPEGTTQNTRSFLRSLGTSFFSLSTLPAVAAKPGFLGPDRLAL